MPPRNKRKEEDNTDWLGIVWAIVAVVTLFGLVVSGFMSWFSP